MANGAPSQAQELLERGAALYEEGRLYEALSCWKQVLRIEPENEIAAEYLRFIEENFQIGVDAYIEQEQVPETANRLDDEPEVVQELDWSELLDEKGELTAPPVVPAPPVHEEELFSALELGSLRSGEGETWGSLSGSPAPPPPEEPIELLKGDPLAMPASHFSGPAELQRSESLRGLELAIGPDGRRDLALMSDDSIEVLLDEDFRAWEDPVPDVDPEEGAALAAILSQGLASAPVRSAPPRPVPAAPPREEPRIALKASDLDEVPLPLGSRSLSSSGYEPVRQPPTPPVRVAVPIAPRPAPPKPVYEPPPPPPPVKAPPPPPVKAPPKVPSDMAPTPPRPMPAVRLDEPPPRAWPDEPRLPEPSPLAPSGWSDESRLPEPTPRMPLTRQDMLGTGDDWTFDELGSFDEPPPPLRPVVSAPVEPSPFGLPPPPAAPAQGAQVRKRREASLSGSSNREARAPEREAPPRVRETPFEAPPKPAKHLGADLEALLRDGMADLESFAPSKEPQRRRLITAPPPGTDYDALMREARRRQQAGDFTGSLALVEEVLSGAPNHQEARRYLDENTTRLLGMYRSRLGELSRRPSLKVGAQEIIWQSLDHRAGFILSQVDGRTSYEDIITISGMPELEATRILARFVEFGLVG